MSNYTTGEAAKRCGVSVRTIQYYDTRGIVSPSQLTEGGRRLYSEENLRALQTVCFLRSLGLGLEAIRQLMGDDNAQEVVSLLLEQRAAQLRQELEERRQQLEALNQLRAVGRQFPALSPETLGDIAFAMKRKKKLRRLHLTMLLIGIVMDVLLVGSVLLWIFRHTWIPFACCLPCVLALGVGLTALYYRGTAYLCPQCHRVFQPTLRQFLFSAHTPSTRKLKCAHCGHRGFCVEVAHIPESTELG